MNYLTRSYFTNKPQVKSVFSSILSFIGFSLAAFFFSLVPIVNICLYICAGFTGLGIILSILMCIIYPATKTELYIFRDGIRVGKSLSNSLFIPWNKVKSIECPAKTPNGKAGTVIVETFLPHDKKPNKTKKFSIESIVNCADIMDTASELLKSRKS